MRCSGIEVRASQALKHSTPSHLHSGFGQLLDVFLALQVLKLVAELIIGTVVSGKLRDKIQPTYFTTSTLTSGIYLLNVAINLE